VTLSVKAEGIPFENRVEKSAEISGKTASGAKICSTSSSLASDSSREASVVSNSGSM